MTRSPIVSGPESGYPPKPNGNTQHAEAPLSNASLGATISSRVVSSCAIPFRANSPQITVPLTAMHGPHPLGPTSPTLTDSSTSSATFGNGAMTGLIQPGTRQQTILQTIPVALSTARIENPCVAAPSCVTAHTVTAIGSERAQETPPTPLQRIVGFGS